MNVKTITQRLNALQQVADKNRPCNMTVTFSDGNATVTDPIGAWDIVREHMMQEDVVKITADRSDYVAAAGIMTVLCHPAPNRRIADFE